MQIVFTDGLGNQMFQYALYLAMRNRGKQPKLNIGVINRNIVHHGFELCEDFEIDQKDLNIIDGGKSSRNATIIASRYLGFISYREKKYFDPKVFITHKPIISGYWQDERYFRDIEEIVRRAFTFKGIDEVNLKLGKEMLSRNSVCLHIRRGDYLKYPDLMVCSPSYYKRAIAYMREKVDNPFFYVFSDDLEWSNSFIQGLGVNYRLVDLNRGRNSYKDMYLMTCCLHNIIANSSFSWWGAWLGNQENKIVVCPNEWIKGKTKDPCPISWVRVGISSHNIYDKRSFFQILAKEYKALDTGRKPVLLYAFKAYCQSDSFRLTVTMRRMQNCISLCLSRVLKRRLTRHYSVEIERATQIGQNIKFHHFSGIVLGKYASIGEDCHIYQGVLLGQRNGYYPSVGNNVTLYPYSCIIGDVHVGDNSVVAAHSVVLHDVPPNCMVAGNPARVVKHFK